MPVNLAEIRKIRKVIGSLCCATFSHSVMILPLNIGAQWVPYFDCGFCSESSFHVIHTYLYQPIIQFNLCSIYTVHTRWIMRGCVRARLCVCLFVYESWLRFAGCVSLLRMKMLDFCYCGNNQLKIDKIRNIEHWDGNCQKKYIKIKQPKRNETNEMGREKKIE